MKRKNYNLIISITAVLLAVGTFRYYSQVRENKVEKINTNTEKPITSVNTYVGSEPLPLPSPEIKATPEVKAHEPEAEETIKTVRFIKPSSDQVLLKYIDDKLIYFKDMGDWRAHEAVDFGGEKQSEVFAVADGRVKEIFNDNLYGLTIRIEHANSLVSCYASLSSADVAVDTDVKCGQAIGKSGNSAVAENSRGNHLHFYMESGNKRVNPFDIID